MTTINCGRGLCSKKERLELFKEEKNPEILVQARYPELARPNSHVLRCEEPQIDRHASSASERHGVQVVC